MGRKTNDPLRNRVLSQQVQSSLTVSCESDGPSDSTNQSLAPHKPEREARWPYRCHRIPSFLVSLLLVLILIMSDSPQHKRVKTVDTKEGETIDNEDNNDGPHTPRATICKSSVAATQLERLALVTYNVAACRPSARAPRSWDEEDSLQAMAEEVLHEEPDIIALQEFPEIALNRTSRLFPDHALVGSKTSHAPYVVLLVRKGIQTRMVPVDVDDSNSILPAVVAELTFRVGAGDDEHCRRLWVASVHLEPFGDGAEVRHRQVKTLRRLALQSKVPLIVAGDFNMRVAEDTTMEGASYNLLDFWKLAGSDNSTKYTWNTRNEISNGGYFNQYYGDDTREYIARYDRIYYHCAPPVGEANGRNVKDKNTGSQNVAKTTPIHVESFKLIANKPVGSSKHHFLSDHFGISSTLHLQWGAD